MYAADNPVNRIDPLGALSWTDVVQTVHDVTGVAAGVFTICTTIFAPTSVTVAGASVTALCAGGAVVASGINAATAVELNTLGKESNTMTALDVTGFFAAGWAKQLGELADTLGTAETATRAASVASENEARLAANQGDLLRSWALFVQSYRFALGADSLGALAVRVAAVERRLDAYGIALSAYAANCL